MSEGFDPYYSWLGIPVSEQPADHYRLLGVQRFESNLDVISNAADRQMAFVQTFKTGKHSADSQRVLNEISAAKLCLLNPAKRAEYDAGLRGRLAESATAIAPGPPVAAPLSPLTTLPPTTPFAAGVALPADDSFSASPGVSAGGLFDAGESFGANSSFGASLPWDSAAPLPSVGPVLGGAVKSSSPASAARSATSELGKFTGYIAGAVVGGLVGLAAAFALAPGPSPRPRDLASVSPPGASPTVGASDAAASRLSGPAPEGNASVVASTAEASRAATPEATTRKAPIVFTPVVPKEPMAEATSAATSSDAPNGSVGPNGSGEPTPEVAPTPGEWINLLEWSEGVDWKPRGIDWNAGLLAPATRDGVTLKAKEGNRFPLPAIIQGDYELEAEFTRTRGNDVVAVFFPVGDHNMYLGLASHGGDHDRVAWINGDVLKTTTDGRSAIVTNQRHRVVVRVTRRDDKAKFEVDLDDRKNYIVWEGRYVDLTNIEINDWRLTMIRRPWLGCWDSEVAFHQVRVRMYSGELRRDVYTEEDRRNDLENGLVRLVYEPMRDSQPGWAGIKINQMPLELEGHGACEREWPLVTPEITYCDDYYSAHAPSKLVFPVPKEAKSFSVVGFNLHSRTSRFIVSFDGRLAYDSGVTGFDVIKVDVPAGAANLELIAHPAGDNGRDWTHWCYPRFHRELAADLTDDMLDRRSADALPTVLTARELWNNSFSAIKSLTEEIPAKWPLNFRCIVPCEEFFFAHAKSSMKFNVPKGMTRFTAVGFSTNRGVKYRVLGGSEVLFESDPVGFVGIDVKLPRNARVIELQIDDLGGDQGDHSMWCYPRLHRD